MTEKGDMGEREKSREETSEPGTGREGEKWWKRSESVDSRVWFEGLREGCSRIPILPSLESRRP
eukprot:1327871-Amorphochlora_amoeboformis.AAC.1